MLGAGEDAVEQPLPDAPALERVELDGQRVVDLVGVVADADAEPLAQERAHGVLDEADEVLELDERRRSPRGSGPARNGAAGARSVASARAPSSVTGSKLHGRSGTSSPTVKFLRVERLQRVPDLDPLARRAVVGARPCGRSTSSSSPIGTAGGAARFVRSSLPV